MEIILTPWQLPDLPQNCFVMTQSKDELNHFIVSQSVILKTVQFDNKISGEIDIIMGFFAQLFKNIKSVEVI